MNWMQAVLVGVLGQVDAAGGEASAMPTVWDMALKGGPMMIPIALGSLVALTIVIERAFSLTRSNVIPPGFLDGVTKALGEDDGREKALSYCERNRCAIASVFEAGIKRLGEPVERIEQHVQEAGERVVFRLRRFLRALSVIAAISPLMGLLGTIFGMIKAFQTVAISGGALGRTELLAAGIYEALITTAAGLLVAIPVLIGYHWLSSRIDRLVMEIDEIAVEFVETCGRDGLISAVSSNGGPRTDGRLSSKVASAAVGAA